MKRFWKFFVLIAVFVSASYIGNAQLIINIRPERPHYVRVAAPSPRHVWIDEDWEWRGGQYVWVGGRWVVPARPGAVWIPGHWRRRPQGWVWMRGHWRW